MNNRWEIDEISLLVYLNRLNKKVLKKTLSKYTGCDEEVYNDYELTRLAEKAISDITRKYHIRGLWFEYFDIRKRNTIYANLHYENYSELDALLSTLFNISPQIFDDEDKNKLQELKREYIEEA